MAFSLLLVSPVAAWARWDQYQGGETHEGVIDAPTAPLRVAWAKRDIDLSGDDIAGGLSAPVVAEDGTIVAVAPGAVLAFEGGDGSERFSVDRDLGPASQPAIGAGAKGPIVVYTEGFGDEDVSASPTASPSPTPTDGSDGDEPFDSHVNAISLETGEPAWPEPVQLDDIVQAPVAVDDSTAYVGDVGGGVTAVDLATGEIRWTADVGTRVAGAVTIDDGRALVAAIGGQNDPSEVWAFDAETGEELWRAAPENGSNLVSAAVVTEGRILALDAFGGVVALHAEDGRTLWRTEVINPLTQAQPFSLGDVSAPVAGEGQVFAADVTGRVYAFDADTGALRWDFALNEANRFSPPVLTDEHVLVATESGLLAAIDRSTGHLAWRVDAGADVLRGLADGGEQIVGVTGIEDAGVVAFAADPERPLLDEPSPTTVNLGELAVGFALGGLLVGLIALALARPLHRRLGPATPSDAGPVEESG